ncbi:MAG: hypothetical protein HC821_05455 [Lewinella sp.]|nr:hypothetical protein [Lewinella sp.]
MAANKYGSFSGPEKEEARTLSGRKKAYEFYVRQFRDRNYQSADFPTTVADLPTQFQALKQFLLHRVNGDFDNSSLVEPLHQTVTNPALAGTPELQELATLYGTYFDHEAAAAKELRDVLNRERQNDALFSNRLLALLLELKQNPQHTFAAAEEQRLSQVIDPSIGDDLTAYFQLTDKIHADGFVSSSVHEAIASEVLNHPGLSDFNENLRQTIYRYFANFARNIGTDGYTEWFDLIGKQYPIYMQVFANEAFNQQLKDLAEHYTRALVKAYPDKRGKDYRDIKKTTMVTFKEWGFMTEKQLKEYFKTPRKKTVPTTAR